MGTNILAVNMLSIMDFQLYLASEGVSMGRRARYVWHLQEIAKILREKQFIDCTERDVREIIGKIESNTVWQGWTQNDFKVFLKRFFRWLRQSDVFNYSHVKLRTKLEYPIAAM